jgi:hypothetical protein
MYVAAAPANLKTKNNINLAGFFCNAKFSLRKNVGKQNCNQKFAEVMH